MYVAACCSRQLSAGVEGFFALIDLPRAQILSAGFRHCWFSSRGSVAPPGIAAFHRGLSSPVPRGWAELLMMIYQFPKWVTLQPAGPYCSPKVLAFRRNRHLPLQVSSTELWSVYFTCGINVLCCWLPGVNTCSAVNWSKTRCSLNLADCEDWWNMVGLKERCY